MILDNFDEKPEIKKLPQPIPAHLPPTDIDKVPKKKSVFLTCFLSLITLGIYSSIWYLKRIPEFYNLGTQKKIKQGFALTLLTLNILFITLIIIIPITITLERNDMGEFFQNVTPLQSILILALGIIFLLMIFICLILAFYSRNIINQALENKGSAKKISGLFTLFFTNIYLQYEINRIINDKENEPRFGPWAFLIIILLLIVFGIVNQYIIL